MSTKFWEDEPLLCDTLGYIAKHGKADESKRRSMFDENLVYGETAELCCNEYKMYLTELAKVCKENGVRFIVITSPHTDRYLAKTNIKGLNTMHDIIDHVNRYYPIEYKNYMNDADFRSDSLYFDDQHLNSVGTDIFTLRIKKDFGI